MYYTIYEISVFDILLQILIIIVTVGFCILILFTSAKKEYRIVERIITVVFLSAAVVLIASSHFEYYDGWEFGYTKYGEIQANDKLKVSYVYDTDYKTNRIVKISRYEKY